jgi:intein/homing endonuclease
LGLEDKEKKMSIRNVICRLFNCDSDCFVSLKAQEALIAKLKTEKNKINDLRNKYYTLYSAVLKNNEALQKEVEKLDSEILFLEEQLGSIAPTHVPNADITYRRPVLVSDKQYVIANIDVRSFVMPDFVIEKSLEKSKLVYDGSQDLDALAVQVYKLAKTGYKYGHDTEFGFSEYVMFPFEAREVLKKGKGIDCIANYEEIHTKEGLKKVGELNEGDIVLSYDWEKKEYCYKPIERIWEKGKLKIKRIHLRNGSKIDVTENHPLWVRTNQYAPIKYEKKCLSEINMDLWYKRKLPTAKKIPYEIKDIKWLTPELCFVIGHFIAEGSVSKSHVETSGYESHIVADILEKHGIPFSEYKNGSGVPIISFLKSDFKEYLKKMLRNSFDITLPEELFHLPEEKIRSFLEGYLLGDGYIDNRAYPFKHNNQFIYNTSSDKLKEDLIRLHLQLGEPLYTYFCKNHGGVGKKPIWRIHYNPKSFFAREHGYKDLSETSIVKIEDLPEAEVRDFHVKDTSTFFFKNGLCSHQCDDWSNVIGAHFAAARIPKNKWLISYGITRGGYGHATIYVKDSEGNWRHLNSTTPWNKKAKRLQDFPTNKDKMDLIGIKESGFWFSFNDVFSCSKFETTEAKKAFEKENLSAKVLK